MTWITRFRVACCVAVLVSAGQAASQALFVGQKFQLSPAPYALAMGDLNGDTVLDAVVPSNQSDDVSVLLGNGDGTFQAATTSPGNDAPASLTLADFDGDVVLEVVTAHLVRLKTNSATRPCWSHQNPMLRT